MIPSYGLHNKSCDLKLVMQQLVIQSRPSHRDSHKNLSSDVGSWRWPHQAPKGSSLSIRSLCRVLAIHPSRFSARFLSSILEFVTPLAGK
jgi:hypothetical protein